MTNDYWPNCDNNALIPLSYSKLGCLYTYLPTLHHPTLVSSFLLRQTRILTPKLSISGRFSQREIGRFEGESVTLLKTLATMLPSSATSPDGPTLPKAHPHATHSHAVRCLRPQAQWQELLRLCRESARADFAMELWVSPRHEHQPRGVPRDERTGQSDCRSGWWVVGRIRGELLVLRIIYYLCHVYRWIFCFFLQHEDTLNFSTWQDPGPLLLLRISKV